MNRNSIVTTVYYYNIAIMINCNIGWLIKLSIICSKCAKFGNIIS